MTNMAKYQVVEDYLKDAIASGKLSIGDQIMTEEELCQHFGFSRTTVGKALDNLRASGFIERTPGRGSFVKASHLEKQALNSRSFSDDMKAIGLEPGARLLSYEVLRSDELPEIAASLRLDSDAFIHHFKRLRTGDQRPIAIQDTYVSGSVIPSIDLRALEGSFYAFIRQTMGLNAFTDEMKFSATIPNEEQARLLEADNIALLCSAHSTFTQIDGKLVPFEYAITYYNSDVYTYTVTRS